MSTFPNLLGCARLAPAAILRVLMAPRITLLVVSVCLAAAVFVAGPAYHELARWTDFVPGAGGRFGQVLFDDVERLHSGTEPHVGASGLLILILAVFFAGGVLAIVGVPSTPGERRAGVGGFLAASGATFFRSLRCWLVFAVLLMLWTWISIGLAKPWLSDKLVTAGNETSMYRFDVGVNIVWLIGFAKLWVARRLALANLVLHDRRSAFLGWSRTVGLALRHPFGTSTAFLVLFLVWGLVLVGCGLAVDTLLAGGSSVLAGIVGSVACGFSWVVLMAAYVLARNLWMLDAEARAR